MVTMAVVFIVVKVMVWDAAIIDMAVVVEVLVIDVLDDAEFIVVVIVLKFTLSSSQSLDVSSDVADVMLDVLSVLGVEVLTNVNANAFAVVMTALGFPVSTPLEEFSR